MDRPDPDPPLRGRVAGRGTPRPARCDPADVVEGIVVTVEDLAVARARAAEARAWLRALTPLVEHLSAVYSDARSEAAQQAVDATLVATLARVRRLVRSDLGPGD